MAEQMISHYRVIEKLGEGGMGVVYKAEDTNLGRLVALKFLAPHLLSKIEEIERFKAEARAASSLNHPSICTIYDIDEADEQWFIAMEYLDGDTLARLLARQAPAPRDALEYAIQTCQALAVAHSQGIVHGDIKPSNLFLTKEKRIKLLDFGLSRVAAPTIHKQDTTEKLEQVRAVTGTFTYMSPEQAHGWKTDCRSDIFSFGVVLYEMLTGRPPFEANSAAGILSAIIGKEPVSIDLLCPEAPSDFRRVVHKCLHKELELRYQHVDDLLVDLRLVKGALHSRESVAWKKEKSVAVLPFLNLSDKREDGYFCEGITEDITTDLSKIEGLRVASRWLAKSHVARGMDVRGTGRELGVDSILQGSVRRAGKRLRITAQLINVADGFHLWAEKFDREPEDIFAVQDEIAVAIARALQVRLTGTDRETVQRRGTKNSEAYEEFTKGRFHYWYRNTAADVEAAERHYRRALELDPSYARAWIGMADIYNLMWFRGSPERSKLLGQSKSALDRAEEIDPAMSFGHGARATYHALAGDVMLAERIVHDGLEISPEAPHLHFELGSFQLAGGDLKEAEKSLMTALKLDPLFHFANIYLSILEGWYRRDAQKAFAHADEVLAFVPDFSHALRVKAAWNLILMRDLEEAIRLMDKARQLDRPWPYQLAMEAIALAGLNRRKEALARIEQASAENSNPKWGIPDQAQCLNTIIALSILHELGAALEWLEKTVRVFLNSYNPRLFDILDNLPQLEPMRQDDHYEMAKKEYLNQAKSFA